jgi:hypothetical protein
MEFVVFTIVLAEFFGVLLSCFLSPFPLILPIVGLLARIAANFIELLSCDFKLGRAVTTRSFENPRGKLFALFDQPVFTLSATVTK